MKVHAGDLTAMCVFSGSLLRPVGGALSDRIGGLRVLFVLFATIAALASGIASLPPLWLVLPLLVITMPRSGWRTGRCSR